MVKEIEELRAKFQVSALLRTKCSALNECEIEIHLVGSADDAGPRIPKSGGLSTCRGCPARAWSKGRFRIAYDRRSGETCSVEVVAELALHRTPSDQLAGCASRSELRRIGIQGARANTEHVVGVRKGEIEA